jgi:hypothetical protein
MALLHGALIVHRRRWREGVPYAADTAFGILPV